jgi:hypothetical protein
MPVIPALRRLRQESKASLGYLSNMYKALGTLTLIE